MNLREEIALKLLKVNAIKLSPRDPFTWASGMKSPIYCDNRILLSYPAERKQVIDQFITVARNFEPFDAIAGVATAGIAHGAFIAQRMEKPFAYVRSKAKEHGRQNLIEGLLTPGQRVLIVEDLISTGGSSLAAVHAVRDHGCEVVAVVAIFEYLFPQAREKFEAANCPFVTLTDYMALIHAAKKNGDFNEEEFNLLESWHHSPKEWWLKKEAL